MTELYHHEIVRAIEQDAAPTFDFAGVEQRARLRRPALRPRRVPAFLAVFLVALPCLAAAAVIGPSAAVRQAIIEQLQQWHITTAGPHIFQMAYPIAPDAAIQSAEFRLVLPPRLPADARLTAFVGNAGKTSYSAHYALPGGHKLWFMFEKKTPGRAYVPWFGIVTADDAGRHLKVRKFPARIWFVGNEVVTAASDSLTAAQLRAIERAMGGTDAPLHRGLVR